MRSNNIFFQIKSFASDKRGNIASIFAFTILPVLGMVGSAMDYGQLTNTRSAMKQAADMTALSMAKLAPSKTASELQTAAEAYYRANLSIPVSNLVVTVAYDKPNAATSVTATADVDMAVMKAFGINTMSTTAKSAASVGGARLRVALAIDVTGSMDNDGKMEATQTATKSLIDQLQQAGSANGDVYVSLVPFNKNVNIGNTNSSASWLNWSTWDDKNGTCRDRYGNTRSKSSKSSCMNDSSSNTWTPKAHTDWNGCVMDRNQNFDTTATIPTSLDTNSYFPTEQYGSCPAQMMQLTNNFTALKAKVDALSPDGNTNQSIGFVWAWQTLVGGAGMTVPAEESGYNYEYIIIHMSDGLNTQNRWYSNASDIDARQKIACDNAKAAGFTIYTVQVDTGNDGEAAALAYCASDNMKFKIAKNAPQILATFDQIGNGMNKARLSE